MNKLIKQFDEPTDIVISGRYYEGEEAAVLITDDEHSYYLEENGAGHYKDCIGYVYIFTKEEYEKVKHLEEDTENFDITFIDSFKGSIELQLSSCHGNQVCETEDFDLKEYIMYQTPNSFDWGDVFILLNRKS